MKKKRNVLLISSILTLVMLVIITSFAFAYFTADTSASNSLNVSASIDDLNIPVFSAYSSGSLDLTVTTKDMLEISAGSAISAYQNLYVTLIGGNSTEPITCNFDIEYNWNDSSYTKSPAAISVDLKEYTIQVFNQYDSALSNEFDMQNISNGTKLIPNQSISSSGALTTFSYKIVVKIYNLNVEQNIYNNSYKGIVTASNIVC